MTLPQHVQIIAEAGVNHNGSLDMARQLIDVAAEAGADYVKFQSFITSECMIAEAPKTDYQLKTTGEAESQLEMARKLELNEDDHRQLIAHCAERSIQFMSTAFDVYSLDLLARLRLPVLKLSSGEILNARLFLRAARTQMPVVLSTGTSTLGDVETALGILAYGYLEPERKPTLRDFQNAFCSPDVQRVLQEKITLLHCTTEYPAPFEDVNLRAMDTMAQAFGLPIGLSDHTPGIAVPIAAVARGALCIE
jgi:N-acetylneuraminate synthase